MSERNSFPACPHRELAVGWALHALEPAEESLITAHLPECSECARIVVETEEVSASLGMSIPQEMPSPELGRRVLALAAPSVVAPVVPLVQPAQRPVPVLRARARVFAVAAAVIMIAASVALGSRVVQLENQRNQTERQLAAMSEVMKRVADPGLERVPLVTTDGRAMGVVLAGRDNVVVVPTGLPANQVTDQTYVLWGLRGTEPRALAAFDVTPDAPASRTVRSVGGSARFTGYAVSLEPGRTLPAEPTDVIAMGQVES